MPLHASLIAEKGIENWHFLQRLVLLNIERRQDHSLEVCPLSLNWFLRLFSINITTDVNKEFKKQYIL